MEIYIDEIKTRSTSPHDVINYLLDKNKNKLFDSSWDEGWESGHSRQQNGGSEWGKGVMDVAQKGCDSAEKNKLANMLLNLVTHFCQKVDTA